MMGALDASHGPALSLPWVTTCTQLAQGRLVGGRCVCGGDVCVGGFSCPPSLRIAPRSLSQTEDTGGHGRAGAVPNPNPNPNPKPGAEGAWDGMWIKSCSHTAVLPCTTSPWGQQTLPVKAG